MSTTTTDHPLAEPQPGPSQNQNRALPAPIPSLATFTISSNPNSPIKRAEPHRNRTDTVIAKTTVESSPAPVDPLDPSIKSAVAPMGEGSQNLGQLPGQPRRLDRIQQGLQKIGANLKRNKGKNCMDNKNMRFFCQKHSKPFFSKAKIWRFLKNV